MEVQRILIPVDLSGTSARAVEHGLWLAERLGVGADLLHVAPEPGDYLPLDEWIWGEEHGAHEIRTRVEKSARKELDEFLNGLGDPVRTKAGIRLETGVPWKVIRKLLDEGQYDLAVMGTHGRTGAKHVFIGSTTERVLRHTGRPVLVVH